MGSGTLTDAGHVHTAAIAAPPSLVRRLGAPLLLVVAGLLLSLLAVEGLVRTFHLTRDTSTLLMYEDADFGYAYRPNQVAWSLFGIRLATNRHGLRDRDYPERGAAARVLVLGDSVTMGYGVAAEATYVRQLEARLAGQARPTEVVNAGVEGFNIHNELFFYRKVARRYRPDTVLLLALSNDLQAAAHRVPFISPKGITTGDPHGLLPLSVRQAMRRSAFAVFVNDTLSRSTGSRPDPMAAWPAYDESFRALVAAARADGAKVIVAFFPTEPEARSPEAPAIASALRSASATEGIAFHDLTPAVSRALPAHLALYLPRDAVHPSPPGHAVVAQELARVLAPTTGSTQ
jgi:lysophospholipase L1-like esterase